jgi:polygalacturonase
MKRKPKAKPRAVSVRKYGAKGDGVTDDTEAIIKAAEANRGKGLRFPIGTYLVRITLPETVVIVAPDGRFEFGVEAKNG